jgi:hypothetical protein
MRIHRALHRIPKNASKAGIYARAKYKILIYSTRFDPMAASPYCSGNCTCSSVQANISIELGNVGNVGEQALSRSIFRIPGMDCPAEEQMVRLCLADSGVAAMSFDLAGRTLTLDHAGDANAILKRLLPLGYGAELMTTQCLALTNQTTTPSITQAMNSASDAQAERQILIWLLAINATMFVVELGAGWWAHSAGLVADAMDMFADAAVYAVALYAVGRAARHQLSAAKLAGGLQMLLAFAALAETARHIILGSTPAGIAMAGIATLALIANVVCLLLIFRQRHGGVHMRASYIFSANDVLANLGVIVAGLLVSWTASPWPDWIIGSLIGLLVLVGAMRILRLR